MTKEDIEKLSKIDFPKPFSQEGVLSLLSYLVRNIPSSLVSYTLYRLGTISLNQGCLVDRARPHTLSGYIGVTSENGGTVPFECYRNKPGKENKDSPIFDGLEMITSDFSHVAQIPKHYLELMKLIREKAQGFLELT